MDEFPLIVFNENGKEICDYIKKVLMHPHCNILMVACPYITGFFAQLLRASPVENILVLLDKDPPKYTVTGALRLLDLKQAGKHVSIAQRPEGSPFMHVKLMIPLYMDPMKKRTYHVCAFMGSVNLTKAGLEKNDEGLVVLRDLRSVGACYQYLDSLWQTSQYWQPPDP
jgi:hypothetical protein